MGGARVITMATSMAMVAAMAKTKVNTKNNYMHTKNTQQRYGSYKKKNIFHKKNLKLARH